MSPDVARRGLLDTAAVEAMLARHREGDRQPEHHDLVAADVRAVVSRGAGLNVGI